MRMNRMKTIIACLLCALLLAGACMTGAGAAAETQSGTFRFLNYNIAGLPGSGKADRQALLGQLVKADAYDIVAVQEDFGYDKQFAAGLAPAYRTFGAQNAVMGDGLNLFSELPIYNSARAGWEMKGGMLWEGDIVSQKGVLYAVVELAPGVYLDVYDLHADAFDGAESVAARHSNFMQTAAFIEQHSQGRAVIVTGDFNSSFHFANEGRDLYDIFIDRLGLSDVWAETENDGSYTDYSAFSGSYWGNWDSVEHILYRSSDALTLTALSHDYINYTDETGAPISDHAAAAAEFSYIAAGDTAPATLRAETRFRESPLRVLKVVFADLRYVFTHFSELIYMLKYMDDMPYLETHYSR